MFVIPRNPQPRGLPVEGTLSRRSSEQDEQMLRADLLKPDLLSEIVLLGTAAFICATLVAIIVTVFARAAVL